MACKVGEIITRGDRRWLIRVYLGRDHETKKRNYHNRTIRGSMREAQANLTNKLRERDLGRDLEGAKITLNEYLDRWLEIAVKPRVRQKTCQDYDGILRRYIRPGLGDRPGQKRLQDTGKGDLFGCICGFRLKTNAENSVITNPIGKG
jgi:integrase